MFVIALFLSSVQQNPVISLSVSNYPVLYIRNLHHS